MKLNTRFVATALTATLLATQITAYGAESKLLPPQQKQGTISYVTGGIGVDEANAFKQAAAAYPLTLEFALRAKARDEFLSDIKVTIKDSAGRTRLETVSAGPFLLAKLPQGRYRVSAERHGVSKTDEVDINPGKHARIVFEWR